MATPLPYRASTRPFALVRTRDQWLRASHDGTALMSGGVVELASKDDAPSTAVGPPSGPAAGLAFDSGCRLYHSVPSEGRIERILWAAQDPFAPSVASEAVTVTAPPPPEVLGDFTPAPPSPGALDAPLGLAVDSADRLFVAESGANRVLVYDLSTRRLIRTIALANPGDAGPRPVALAAAGEVVYGVTASPPGLVQFTAGGSPQAVALPTPTPVRIAVSPSGRVAVLDVALQCVAFLDGAPPIVLNAPSPNPLGQPDGSHATDIAFESDDVLVVAYWPGEDFWRFKANPDSDPDLRPLKARGYDGLGIVRQPDGRIGFWTARGFRSAVAVRARFLPSGTVVTFRLDSGDFQTTWGRLFLDACIPDGTTVEIYCATADDEDPDAATVPWKLPANARPTDAPPFPELSPPLPPLALTPEQQIGGNPWRPVHRRESGRELPWSQFASDDPFVTYEAPIIASPGRYLWVWLRLTGNVRLTPKVRCLRAEYPSHDYLRRIPKTFSRDPAVASFLRRYLAIFEGFLGEADARGATRGALLHPFATPDELLPWLASFMGLVLDERWSPAARRTLIDEIADLWRFKGTVCGLSRFLEIYLGIRPIILEDYRLRSPGGAILGAECAPFSTSVVGGGFRLGGEAPGDGPLASEAVAQTFAQTAHRFTVIIPGVLSDEQMAVVQDVLDAQRPAHTLVDVCTMGPGMRVGRALHVGVSSIVGKSSGFETAQLGGSVLGRGAILGRPQPGTKPGVGRVGSTTRLG